MATISAHAPNPYVHLARPPGVQTSRAAALASIQAYLEASKTTPHLHPDAVFSESALTFSGSASSGGVVLHQLRRVEQGLQGVSLGIDPEAPNATNTDNDNANGVVNVNGSAVKTELDAVLDEEPVADYQQQLRQQGHGDVAGEVGQRHTGVGSVDRPAQVVVTNGDGKKRLHGEIESESQLQQKEARKKAKKDRRQAEKKERREQRETQKQSQSSEQSLEQGSSQVTITESPAILNGDGHQTGPSAVKDKLEDVNVDKNGSTVKVQLSGRPNTDLSGQKQELSGEASLTPITAPKAAVDNAPSMPAGADADSKIKEDRAKRKAEKKAKREEKLRKKEEMQKAKYSEV